MTNLQLFMQHNIEYIIAVVVLFISLITLFSVLGVNFNSHRHNHIDKIVTVEAFINSVDDDAKISSNDNEEANISSDDDLDDTGDVPLMDDTEETGSPVRVSFSKKQKEKEDHKAYKQRRIMQLLKEKNGAFQKTLGGDHGRSHCHPVHTTAQSSEEHCNTMNNIQDKCKIHHCCVWLTNDKKCVAGNKDGPTFLTNKGKYVDNSHYYHKGQCHGKDC